MKDSPTGAAASRGDGPFTAHNNRSRTGANREQKFALLVRRATNDGCELVTFMLAVMRGNVAQLLSPPPPTDGELEAIARAMGLVAERGRCDRQLTGVPARLAARLRRQRERAATERRNTLRKLRAALVRAGDLNLTAEIRMKAACWLADRGFGKTQMTIGVNDSERPRVDLSALTSEEVSVFLRLVRKLRAAETKPAGDGAGSTTP